MLLVSLVIFGVAALGGLVLAIQRFSGRPQPALPLALVHGAAAATALVILIIAVAGAASGGSGTPRIALILFIVAALGGFFLFATHLQKKALPIPVVIIHALVAVSGFVLLLLAVAKVA